MWLGRDVLDKLEGVSDANERTVYAAKETVIESFAAAKAVAFWCERHAWNNGEIDAGVVGEDGTTRLQNAKRCASGEAEVALVDVKAEVIALHCGQEDNLSLCMENADEVVGVNFIGKRIVEENRVAILLFLDAIKQ